MSESREILLVDDEEKILNALKRELMPFLGERSIAINTFSSAIDALAYLEGNSENIILIVSDQRMPEMKGSEFLLEACKKYPDIVGIILTAFTEIEDIQKAIKAGIFSYILKPWDGTALVSEIQRGIELYDLRRERKAYIELVKEELRWGGELQKTLLRRDLPVSDKITFDVTYLPLPELQCGGDYYDIIAFSDSCFLVLIGDVSGHGVKAAFITAMLKSIIYSGYISKHREIPFSTSRFLHWLNNRMCDELAGFPGLFITFFACFIDIDRREAVYSNAGHPPVLLVRQTAVIRLAESGMVLGYERESLCPEVKFDLSAGDLLLFYTDGLVDTTGKKMDSMALEGVLVEPVIPGTSLNQHILHEMSTRMPGNIFGDDVLLLTVKIR